MLRLARIAESHEPARGRRTSEEVDAQQDLERERAGRVLDLPFDRDDRAERAGVFDGHPLEHDRAGRALVVEHRETASG